MNDEEFQELAGTDAGTADNDALEASVRSNNYQGGGSGGGGGPNGDAMSTPLALPDARSLLKASVLRKHKKGIADFAMVDWVHDMESHKKYQQKRAQNSAHAGRQQASLGRQALRVVHKVWLECYGWVAVLFIGCVTGLLAGMIHTCVDMLRDLRDGVCSDAFWLSFRNCCPGQEPDECEAWHSWGDYFSGQGIRSSTSTTVLDYFAYLLVSVSFACLSAWLVKTFAPYAAGSGIPEI
eukprot:Rhum_TRINITY_DN14737_c18_g1::Rhum_TRINITY_DN14737_c18_g1_i1::g.113730::m.113730/K05012/CLCN3_4_5; chloride channel 3/4/5